MLGAGRRKLEQDLSDEDDVPEPDEQDDERLMKHVTWVDWIIRTTGIVEEHLRKTGLDDWCTAVRKKKMRWAGHLARRDDGRWYTKLLDGRPLLGYRSRGRSSNRWSDNLDAFCDEKDIGKGSWQAFAQDRETWHALERESAERR